MPRPIARRRGAQRIAALDGMRALAIAGVVLYHLRPSALSGGFLGVTVFFAITGYLATSSATREIGRTGRLSFARHAARRLVRLAPPVLALIGVTAVATYLAAPSLLPKVQADALPGALFCLNWSYIFRQVSYFAAAGLPSPLTHLWYLGVNLQFALVWPLAMLAMVRGLKTRRRALAACGVLALASAVAMALLYDPAGDTARVYYGTDTRAAELLAGACAALAMPLIMGRLRAARERGGAAFERVAAAASTLIALACLVALGIGFALAQGEDPLMYRGGYLACALLCAILIMAVQVPGCAVARLLAAAPLRWLGARSFSLYLVHYPALILMNPATRTVAPVWWEQVLQVLAVLALAELFYRAVERPATAAAGLIGHGDATGAPGPGRVPRVPALSLAALALAGTIAVGSLSFAPVDWQAVADARAVALRPELAGDADGKDPGAAPEDGREPEPADGDEAPAWAEKVPANLDPDRWAADPEAGICDARALIIGDSVTAGAAGALQAALPQAMIDAQVSRQLYTGQDVYAADVASGFDPDVVVFALGGNSLIRDESQVQALIDAVGGKPVYLVTIRSPYPLQDANNEVLRRFAQANDNVGIIDWCGASEGHPEYLVDDGQHLTDAGCDAFAALIRRAICGV